MSGPNSSQNQMQQNQTNWIAAIINCMVFSLESCLHTNFGERYIAAKPVLAVIIMAVFPALFTHEDPGPMYFLIFWFILFRIAGRLQRIINRWRGRRPVHSMYTGRPVLKSFLPFIDEVWIKRLEPLLVLPVGFILAQANRPLGIYIMLCAILLLLATMLQVDAQRQQAMDLNDAMIEQEIVQDRLRNLRK